MITKVRDNIVNKMGYRIKFRVNGSRNQIEEFEGIINGAYSYIFTIKTTNKETRSFTYSDILIGNLEILE